MFDRNKIYGYTTEEIIKNGGYPEDNYIMRDGDPDDILTMDEIKRMFPEQVLLLCNITYNGYRHQNNIEKAAVLKYHCKRSEARDIFIKNGCPLSQMVYSTGSGIDSRCVNLTIGGVFMKIELKLADNFNKPIIQCKLNGIDCNALIDTGAETFICCGKGLERSYKLTPSDDIALVDGINKSSASDIKKSISYGSLILSEHLDGMAVGINMPNVPFAVIEKTFNDFDIIIPYTFLAYFDIEIKGAYKGDKIFIIHNADVKVIYHVIHEYGFITNVFVEESRTV